MVKKCHNKKVKESFIINNLNFRKVQKKITCNIQGFTYMTIQVKKIYGS